jgi:hypothetical protein
MRGEFHVQISAIQSFANLYVTLQFCINPVERKLRVDERSLYRISSVKYLH